MEPRADAIHFLTQGDERTQWFVRSDVAALLTPKTGSMAAIDPWSSLGPVEHYLGGGRRRVEVRSLLGTERKVVAKTLVRGGILGRFLWGMATRRRVDREVAIAQRLLERAVPAIELIALRARHVFPWLPFVRIDYLTAVIADASDGEKFLRVEAARSVRCEVLDRAGAAVRAMHDAGIDHVDLNIRNLVVDPQRDVRVLDFGASGIGDGVTRETRIRNLARLWRSCVKRGLAGTKLSRSDALRFLQGYDETWARELFLAVHREFTRSVRWHRIAWRLSGIR